MKQIFTLVVAFCLSTIAQSLLAQSVTISTTDPGITLNTSVTVGSGNGFSSTNQNTFGTYPKGSTSALTSPNFYYTNNVSSINFKYNYTISTNGSTSVNAPVITIIPASGTPVTITAAAVTIPTGNSNFYFTISLASPLPAYTNFKIKVEYNIPNGDKAVTANTFATNALLFNVAAPLPLKLISYSGNLINNKAQLKWSVTDNETGDHFEIEKSTDSKQFTQVGIVITSDKAGAESYLYNETSEMTGDTYYRVKMVNKNKSFTYSSIIVLKIAKAAAVNNLTVLQNPVQSSLTFNYTTQTAGESEVAIYNAAGVKVYSTKANFQKGNNTLSLDASNKLMPGTYLLEVANKNERSIVKLMKQ